MNKSARVELCTRLLMLTCPSVKGIAMKAMPSGLDVVAYLDGGLKSHQFINRRTLESKGEVALARTILWNAEVERLIRESDSVQEIMDGLDDSNTKT